MVWLVGGRIIVVVHWFFVCFVLLLLLRLRPLKQLNVTDGPKVSPFFYFSHETSEESRAEQ